jgi:N-acetylglucosaminyldiphosphoundecaprenol N-acetyl-beta-D-mannosaminyltransferase
MTTTNDLPEADRTTEPAAAPNPALAPSLRRDPGSRVLLYGLYVDSLTMDQVIERCEQALRARARLQIGVVNAAKIVAMEKDKALRDSLVECDLILADGQSVVWASQLLRPPLPERVTGIDLFERLLVHAEQHDRSVFLLGATDAALSKLQENLLSQFPGLRIAGVRNGYFKEAESPEVAEQIRKSGADMLFIGISSPKKEKFFATYGPTLGVPILHGVGGSFDIFAGITKRAPVRWQKLGMEWAYRLVQEPRRMWRRYLTTNTAFILKTLRELFRPVPPYASPTHQVIDLRHPVPTMTSFQRNAMTGPPTSNPSAPPQGA